MTAYVYIQSEPRLWTVAHYAPDGTWYPESDNGTVDEAAARAAYLNGESSELLQWVQSLADRVAALEAVAA